MSAIDLATIRHRNARLKNAFFRCLVSRARKMKSSVMRLLACALLVAFPCSAALAGHGGGHGGGHHGGGGHGGGHHGGGHHGGSYHGGYGHHGYYHHGGDYGGAGYY